MSVVELDAMREWVSRQADRGMRAAELAMLFGGEWHLHIPDNYIIQPPTDSGRWLRMPANPPRARDLPRSVGNRKARRAEVARRRAR